MKLYPKTKPIDEEKFMISTNAASCSILTMTLSWMRPGKETKFDLPITLSTLTAMLK